MNTDVTEQEQPKRAVLVGIDLIYHMRDLGSKEVQQRRVPMTAHQAMSLFNFVKHRLHGGRLILDPLPQDKEEKQLIIPP